MKRYFRIVSLFLILISIMAILPISTLAETYKYKTLSFDNWYKLTEIEEKPIVYKFKITTDTIITAQWKNYKQSGYNYASFRIYDDKGLNHRVGEVYFDKKQGSDSYVLYKGIYYILMFDNNDRAQIKVTKRMAQSINKDNYCLYNAIQLKKGKKHEIAQTTAHNYYRWYKIKLNKVQKITISGNFQDYFSGYELYDSNMNDIRCSIKDGNIIADGLQPKGTYYFVIQTYQGSVIDQGNYYCIFLK